MWFTVVIEYLEYFNTEKLLKINYYCTQLSDCEFLYTISFHFILFISYDIKKLLRLNNPKSARGSIF